MTNYAEWDAKSSQLLSKLELEDREEEEKVKQDLGLQDGKYPRSQAEADEQRKLKQGQKMRDTLDAYKKKEEGVHQVLSDIWKDDTSQKNVGDNNIMARYITCDDLDAGKRVLTISNTDGPGHIILSQDLTNLKCTIPTNTNLTPKCYPNDAENSVVEETLSTNKVIFGLIKVNLTNLHNLTVSVRCKILTETLEVSHCSNLLIKIEEESTISTTQVDLCKNITIQFHNTPSGASITPSSSLTVLSSRGNSNTVKYWGKNKDDRIFHAGVSNLKVELYRNGCLHLETRADYEENGAVAIGNASAEEVQFVTSVVNGNLITEKVLKPGSLTGTTVVGGVEGSSDALEGNSARAMTEREMKEVKRRRELIEKMIDEKLGGVKVLDANGNEVLVKNNSNRKCDDRPLSESESIVKDCEAQKAKGNEAFTAGEYAQAVLLYTLTLDKAAEIGKSENGIFPRHIVLSNRSACFLKLGHHEKALVDGIEAEKIEPTYVKGVFRKGLALHAMGRYQEATISLSAALKLEPKNKQIKQALQFADVRLQQEMRKKMST